MENIGEKIRQETEADAIEAWKPDHVMAMQCFEMEKLLAIGMQVFRGIREQDEAWSRKVYEGTSQFDSDRARYFRGRYVEWYKPCEEVLSFIDYYEKEYRVIDGSNEFRRARLLVRDILATPIDGVIESMELFKAGEYEEI